MGDSIAILLEEGDRASPHVERAVEIADDRDATLHGVYVIDAWRFGEYSVYGWQELAREIHTEKADELLSAVRDRCDRRGVEFTSTVVEGEPTETVVSFVNDNDIDCLVCPEPDGSGRQLRSPTMQDSICEESTSAVEVA